MKTAVVFLTHAWDAELEARYAKLKREAPADASVFIMAERGSPISAALAGETHVFEFAVLKKRTKKPVGDRLVPGNVHLAFLDFFESHRGFDRYWFIEFDVVFNGDWRVLFDAVGRDAADLVGGNVRRRAEEPGWFWWSSMSFPGGPEPDRWVRSFFPISRLSRAALEAVAERVDAGWTGHHEGLIPAALLDAGLSLSDLGGEGPFVPEERRARFYTSVSSTDGEMILGTLRAAPPHFLPYLFSGLIYHPVKKRRVPNWGDVLKMRQRLGVLLRGRFGAWIGAYRRLRSS